VRISCRRDGVDERVIDAVEDGIFLANSGGSIYSARGAGTMLTSPALINSSIATPMP
jgi:hypothetical protein